MSTAQEFFTQPILLTIGLFASVVALWSFFRDQYRALRSNLSEANEDADRLKELVSQLLSRATTPARRADIYAYITFRTIQREAVRTREALRSLFDLFVLGFTTTAVCVTLLFGKFVPKVFFAFFSLLWVLSLVWVLFVAFKTRRKEQLDRAWKIGVNEVMGDKLRTHLGE